MKIDFEFDTVHGKFRDAISLPDNHGLSDSEIEDMKVQRRDNWIALVENPPVEVESDIMEIDGVIYEKIEINGQTVLKPIGN
jgi:hypothetical protein